MTSLRWLVIVRTLQSNPAKKTASRTKFEKRLICQNSRTKRCSLARKFLIKQP